jgi:hypothetical protein
MSQSSKGQSSVKVKKTKKVGINETKQQKKNFNKIEFYYRQPEKEGPDDNEIPDEAMSMN